MPSGEYVYKSDIFMDLVYMLYFTLHDIYAV